MTGAWNPEKVDAFRDGFFEFLNCVSISSKETGATILGDNLYRAQHMFYDTVFEGLSEDIHDFYVLKSRQLGISTGTRALTLFWLGMHGGLRGTLVFDTGQNTQAARRELTEILNSLPPRLGFPKIKKGGDNRDVLILDNNSWLIFATAGIKNGRSGGGLGRSLGINLVHASEICSWVSEEGIVSFRQSLAETYPDRLYIWESTGRGYNIWYDLWQEAKDDPLSKRTLFIGWWAKDNQIIARSDVRFSIYGSEPPNQREGERINAVREQYGWEITPEQLAWYRWKTDPARELDDDEAVDTNTIQEQPFTEEECFQATGSSFFMADKLASAMAVASKEKASNFRFWPGIDFVTSDIQPARTRREVEFRMWEEPVNDSVYIVSADPAFGHNELNNNSAAQVLRCYADSLDQVGEYASATIQPHQFCWLLWTLIGYYGSTKPGCRVYFICEINGPGEEVWRQFQATQQIVQNGYLRTAAREKGIADIFSNVSRYIYARSDSMGAGFAYQWKTNLQNKIQIMEATRNYMHNGVLLVRSMETLEEMRTITRDGDTIEAENKKRDDRTFALALGIRYWDQTIRRQMIAGNRTKEAERAKLSMSIEDQWALFHRNRLQDFHKRKAVERNAEAWQMNRTAWRQGLARRPMLRPR